MYLQIFQTSKNKSEIRHVSGTMHFRREHPGIARCTLGVRLKSLAVTAGIAKELRVFSI